MPFKKIGKEGRRLALKLRVHTSESEGKKAALRKK